MTKKTLLLSGGAIGVLLTLLFYFLALIVWPVSSASGVQEITTMWKWEAGKAYGSGAWQKLPDYWNKKGQAGTWHYLGNFVLTPTQKNSDIPLAIHAPRTGNRFAIRVNGINVAQMGRFHDNQSDHSHQVHIFQFPDISLRTGANEILVTVQGERLRAAGLPILQIGPTNILPTDRLSPLLFSPPMTFAIVLLAFVMSCLFGRLFFQRRSWLYFFVTMTCVSGCVHLSTLLSATPVLDYHWWTVVFEASICSFIVFLGYFAYTALNLNKTWLHLATAIFLLGALLLIPTIAFLRSHDAWLVWTKLALSYGWFVTLSLCYAWWLLKNKIARVVALAAIFGCVLGTIDHFNLFFAFSGFYKAYFLRFILLGFLLAVSFIMLELNAQERLASETARLRAQHQHEQEKREVQKQERTRFMQNLHDGMGMQLQGLLALAESDKNNHFVREVRATIAQMRMAIDNLQDFDGTLIELLGQIRYRIAGFVSLFDIDFLWENETTKSNIPQEALRPMACVHLQQVFYELTTNVIKHAQASRIHIHVSLNPEKLVIDFSDNGVGLGQLNTDTDTSETFNTANTSNAGVGTQNIRRRVQELNGTVHWEASEQSGTQCTIVFVLQALYTPPDTSGLLLETT